LDYTSSSRVFEITVQNQKTQPWVFKNSQAKILQKLSFRPKLISKILKYSVLQMIFLPKIKKKGRIVIVRWDFA